MDKLIAYFSASGVTERAARDLASAAGAALYRIEPEKHIQRQISTGLTE